MFFVTSEGSTDIIRITSALSLPPYGPQRPGWNAGASRQSRMARVADKVVDPDEITSHLWANASLVSVDPIGPRLRYLCDI